MENSQKQELRKALAVCVELTGSDLSEVAARVMAEDLERYPFMQVMGALTRCRRELRGRMSLADILERLDDGRPGAQEAWAIVAPTLDNEGVTIVWTDEMRFAMGVARQCDDTVAARMAFLEHYRAGAQKARDAGLPVRWEMSLGHDPDGRDGPLLAAVAEGKLLADNVNPHLKGLSAPDDLLRLSAPVGNVPALTKPRQTPPEFKALVAKLTGKHSEQLGIAAKQYDERGE